MALLDILTGGLLEATDSPGVAVSSNNGATTCKNFFISSSPFVRLNPNLIQNDLPVLNACFGYVMIVLIAQRAFSRPRATLG
jgi:hypothetical protein